MLPWVNVMRERIWIKIGSKKFHLVKALGALVVIGSALMLLSNVYNVVSAVSMLLGPGGRMVTIVHDGFMYTSTIDGLEASSRAAMLLVPSARVLFWSAVLVLGTFIYRTGGFVLPITELITKIKEDESEEDSESRGSKARKRYRRVRDRKVCDICGKEFDSERGMKIHRSRMH